MFQRRNDDRGKSPPPEDRAPVPAASDVRPPLPPEPEAPSSPSTPTPLEDVNLATAPSRTVRAAPLRETSVGPASSFLGEHTVFEGKIHTEETLHVRGQVTGEIASTAAIYVEATARLKADVSGASLLVAGHVEGTVRSTGRVELTPTAQVVGEVHAGTLVMQEGARVEGQLHMASATPPPPAPATPLPIPLQRPARRETGPA